MIVRGTRNLLGSKKGSLTLMLLVVISAALFLGKIDGTAFVAALTVVSGIYCASSAAIDMRNGGGPQQ